MTTTTDNNTTPTTTARVVYPSGTYSCPKCGTIVTVCVNMTALPVCWSHMNKTSAVMQLITNKKTKTNIGDN